MKVSINNKEVETDAVTLLQLTTELSLPAQVEFAKGYGAKGLARCCQ